MTSSPGARVRAALVGGPMYDPLYETIPHSRRATGMRVEIVAQLPHPELNAFVKDAFESGTAAGRHQHPHQIRALAGAVAAAAR